MKRGSDTVGQELLEKTREASRKVDNFLQASLMSDAPPRLFHYTTTHGLLGIWQSKLLYATQALFTNDRREVKYTCDILIEEGLAHQEFNPSAFREHLGGNVFLACFSENGDLLSQWRGYASSRGFSIGFNTEHECFAATSFIADENYFGWKLIRVIYDHQRIVEVLNFVWEAFAPVLDLQAKINSEEVRYGDGSLALLRYISLLSVCFKDPGFSEEAEWRLVASMGNVLSRPDLKYHASDRGIVPYVEWHFRQREAIGSIIMGPGVDQVANEFALGALVNHISYMPRSTTIKKGDLTIAVPNPNPGHRIEIVRSTIPYSGFP